MEKMILSICELEITNYVVFKCFCCRSEIKHGGPADPDLLLLKRSKVISSPQLMYQYFYELSSGNYDVMG